MRALDALTVLVVLPATMACSDPVHQAQVDALGGEVGGVPPGEFHRPGQACTVCHGPMGPASQQFTVAGTVFAGSDNTVGVDQAEILLVDSLGRPPLPGSVVTNCVGNFFVTSDTWDPAFPIIVGIAKDGAMTRMIGHIGRETSCGNCHIDPPGLSSPGHVYITVTPEPDNPNCPVSPVAQLVP